jgi:predicted transcriptional regulator
MTRPKTSGPTKRELEILQVLWESGPSTTKEVHETLRKKHKTAYNSVLTILSIMLEKGYVTRDETEKSHVYEATYSKAHIEETMVKTFMDGVFGGSAMRLVTRALSLKGTSQEDRRKIRQLLKEMEGGRDNAD